MAIHSAGILLHRRQQGVAQVFLVHPGGPYWAKKDLNAWSIPKGIVDPDEDHLLAAQREFREETGFLAEGTFRPLGTFRQPSGKQLSVWMVEGDCDLTKLVSNSFDIIWPPKSGRMQSFPEVDRGGWFAKTEAMAKIVKGQQPILRVFFEQPDGT